MANAIEEFLIFTALHIWFGQIIFIITHKAASPTAVDNEEQKLGILNAPTFRDKKKLTPIGFLRNAHNWIF